MLKQPRTRNVKLIFFLILFTILIGRYLYINYYHIDLRDFNFSALAYVRQSPDKKKTANIWVKKEQRDSDIAYIQANLRVENMPKVDGKTVFWQKVSSDSMLNITEDGSTDEFWIDVYWVDSENIHINGVTFNTEEKFFDYRRGLSIVPSVVTTWR